MRRVRLRTRGAALFLMLFVMALVALLPMRLALGWLGLAEQGMTARRVSGSIWSASLAEARFGAVALGDVEAGLAPLPLLVGRARVLLSNDTDSSPRRLSGALTIRRHAFGIEDVTATLPVGDAFAPVPVTTLELDGVSAGFESGSCVAAGGRVRATLAGGMTGPMALSGTARCDAGALLLPLVDAAGADGVTLRIWGDGRYRAELALVPADPAATAGLQAAGFVETGGRMSLAIEGRF